MDRTLDPRDTALRRELAGDTAVGGDENDLYEIVGTLMDGASTWAASEILVPAASRNGRVIITVEEDGPGIGPEEVASILTRGHRADRQGPGVGRSVVSELVELHAGMLSLEPLSTGGARPAAGREDWLAPVPAMRGRPRRSVNGQQKRQRRRTATQGGWVANLRSEDAVMDTTRAHSTEMGMGHAVPGPMATMPSMDLAEVTHTGVRSGDWSSPDDGAGGRIPDRPAHVHVPSGLTVTVDGAVSSDLKTVRVDGTLTICDRHRTSPGHTGYHAGEPVDHRV
ncbi:MAG: ATP-binding protein [Pseudomonadota bacterium]